MIPFRKPLLTLATALGMVFVGGCDGSASPLTRSGMASPMRYDEEPTKVKLRDMYMVIPANCFDSPLEAEGPSENGYFVTGGVYLVMLYPKLECRNHKNRLFFSKTGPYRPSMGMLVSSMGPGRDVKDAFDAIFHIETTERIGRQTPVSLISRSDAEEIYVMQARTGLTESKFTIYKSIEDNAFTVCRLPPPPQIPGCSLRFIYGTKHVSVGFGGSFAGLRKTIKDSVTRKLDGFRRFPNGHISDRAPAP